VRRPQSIRSAVAPAVRFAAHAVVGAAALAAILLVVVPVARIAAALRQRRGAQVRVLRAPIPIISIRFSSLADRLQGYRSDTLVYDVYSINARDDYDHLLDLPRRSPLVRLLGPYAVLAWALARYDILVLFFDGGVLAFTPWWRAELPLLKLGGKRIVAYPYGGDARLPSVTRTYGAWHAYTDVPPGEEDRDERQIRSRLAAFGRWSDAILGCADLVDALPRVDGIFQYPIDLSAWSPVEEVEDDVVTVAHSPNHRHYKGTRFLIAAVERLRAEGVPVELVLVEGLPNAEARRIYASADVIADQFLIGAYAQFAIEGMALGKPVLCFLNERFAPYHPEWQECPIVNASPDTLADALRTVATDAALRRRLGREGVDYVHRVHSLEAVGRDLDLVYRRVLGQRAR